jgi:hypothetical protein
MPLMIRIVRGMWLLVFIANLVLSNAAQAAPDRTVVRLTFSTAKKGPIDVWVTRADGEDQSLVVKLIAKGVGPRPQSLTLYSGGGGDDGPSVGELRGLTARVIDLPMAGKAVRVDFTYQVPGQTAGDEQTDTTLVGFDGKTRKLLHLVTRRTHKKSELCSEAEETALQPEGDELDGRIVAERRITATPALGDDDEPLDMTCVSQKGLKKVFRFTGEKYLEAGDEPQPSPSPSPVPMRK